jgi:alpha-beta hydrolase superfamily lysophospholipase
MWREVARRCVLPAAVLAAALVAASCTTPSPSTAPPSAASTTTETGQVRLIAAGGLIGLLDRERRSSRREPSTQPSGSTTTTTTPAAVPFPVAHTSMTFVDTTRSSPARGDTPTRAERTLVTTVYYPSTDTPTAATPAPPAAAGPFPLIVFAHGYDAQASMYAPLLEDLARGGYIVAAPEFPGTSSAHPGPADRPDTLQQPADLSFLITSMLAVSMQPGLLHDSIDPNEIGDSGHSDGGVAAAATAYNTCCIDGRIRAATILTGGAFGFDGQWFPPGTPPVMFVHATADEINPYQASVSMFEQAQAPKYLLTIEGGSHLEVFIDPPWEPPIAQSLDAFYDLYLKHDTNAHAQLHTVANQPGLLSLQEG